MLATLHIGAIEARHGGFESTRLGILEANSSSLMEARNDKTWRQRLRISGSLSGTRTSPLPPIRSNWKTGVTAEVYAASRW